MDKNTFIIKPTQFFTLLIYVLIFLIWGFSYYYDLQEKFTTLSNSEFSSGSALTHIFTFILMWVNVILMRMINKGIFPKRVRTILPDLIYVLLITTWLPLHTNYMAQISVALILIMLNITFEAYRNKESQENVFVVFLLISVLTAILHEWLILIPFFFLFFKMLRGFSLKVFLAGVLGFLPALSFTFGYSYLIDDKLPAFIRNRTELHFNWLEINNTFLIFYISFLFLLFIISFVQMNLLSRQDKTKPRKYRQILKILILVPVILIVCCTETTYMVLPLLGMIFSILFSYSIVLRKSLLNQVIFYLYVVISIIFPFALMVI